MSNIEIKVIKKKKESLILSIVMIILCIISLIFFSSDYLKVLNNEYVNINNSKSLEDAIKNKERYVRADLRKAKLEVYSLENKNKKKLNLYTLDFDNKKVMIFLRDNTIITDKVYLNIESFDGNKKSIKELLNNSDYYDAILSNENFILNRDIDLTKMHVIYILIILSIVTIILDIYYINNPKKTNTYKKYMKKLYI